MTLGSAIAIVVATAVTGAAMTAGGSDERAGSTTATSPAIATASTSPLATMGASVSSEATTSTSSTVPVATMPLQAVPTTVMTTTTNRPVFDFLTAGTAELRTDDDSGGWISSLPTSPDGLTDVELSWASFVPATRFLELRATDEPLDPARIVSLAFSLVDGIEGPFRLGVRSTA